MTQEPLFSDIPLIEPLQRALAAAGYKTPTPIQAQAIPHLLDGADLMGIAQTGTGKTAAFTLPMLQYFAQSAPIPGKPRALILAPTRELAAQIGDSIRTYGKTLPVKHTVIFGGVGQNPQVQAVRRGVTIVVATPGRLLDLMNQGHVSLDLVEVFVLDEADRMLDMGFIHDVKKIISKLPKERQSMFFSATMSGEIDKLARQILTDPIRVEVTPPASTVERIDQHVLFVEQKDKDHLLLTLLEQEHLDKVLVFTRTKHRANKLSQMLNKCGIKSDAIHGNKSQTARTAALKGFRDGRVRVLVATDIAARGIDIDEISHVINVDLPLEPESYVHRIGRTARAGAEGTAYSFCAPDERSLLNTIQRVAGMEIPIMEDHKYHSEKARNARGSDARPAPKQQQGRGGGQRRGGPSRGPKPKGGENKGSWKSRQGNSGPRKPRTADGEARKQHRTYNRSTGRSDKRASDANKTNYK